MIKVSDLTFAYDKTKVLDDISFEIGKGELVAVLGPNGAGKSTLFKCMLGLMKKYEGTIRMGGRDIRELSRREMARRAAYIPQFETQVFNYTVLDTVLMGTTGMLTALKSPGREQIEKARQAIAYMGIEHLKSKGINEISGGERQLVLLARALAQDANVLVMDEPAASLDYGNQQAVLRHIHKMASEGHTIMMSTHNPEHALQYATYVLAIKDHRILAEGPAFETLDEDLISELYGLDVKIIGTREDGRLIRSCIPAR